MYVQIVHNLANTLCPPCTDFISSLRYTVCTIYRLYTPLQIHCVHCVRCASCTHIRKYTMYTDGQVVHTFEITKIILCTILYILENTQFSLCMICTPPLRYTVYTVQVVHTLENTQCRLCNIVYTLQSPDVHYALI